MRISLSRRFTSRGERQLLVSRQRRGGGEEREGRQLVEGLVKRLEGAVVLDTAQRLCHPGRLEAAEIIHPAPEEGIVAAALDPTRRASSSSGRRLP